MIVSALISCYRRRCASSRASAFLVLVAVQNRCPGCPSQHALPAHGQSEPVPVEDHVVAEHLSQSAIQRPVLDAVGECSAGAVECGGPFGDGFQRASGAQ